MRATWATLMSVFHLAPWEIMRLTDRQIHELYYHPREEDGSIKPVQTLERREPRTLQEDLLQWDILCSNTRQSEEIRREGREKLKKKWAEKEADGTAG